MTRAVFCIFPSSDPVFVVNVETAGVAKKMLVVLLGSTTVIFMSWLPGTAEYPVPLMALTGKIALAEGSSGQTVATGTCITEGGKA